MRNAQLPTGVCVFCGWREGRRELEDVPSGAVAAWSCVTHSFLLSLIQLTFIELLPVLGSKVGLRPLGLCCPVGDRGNREGSMGPGNGGLGSEPGGPQGSTGGPVKSWNVMSVRTAVDIFSLTHCPKAWKEMREDDLSPGMEGRKQTFTGYLPMPGGCMISPRPPSSLRKCVSCYTPFGR